MGNNASASLQPTGVHPRRFRTLNKVNSPVNIKKRVVPQENTTTRTTSIRTPTSTQVTPEPERKKKRQEKKRLAAFFETDVDDTDSLCASDNEDIDIPVASTQEHCCAVGRENEHTDETVKSFTKLRYVKKQEIGIGLLGKVFLAEDTEGHIAAVKELQFATDPSHYGELLLSLQLHLRSLSQLQHPNLVQYISAEHGQHSLDILMELISGGSLSTFIHRYGKPEPHLLHRWTHELLSALNFLHQRGIAHSQLRSSNILITSEGHVKLSDWAQRDVSSVVEQIHGGMTSAKGSPFWTAPETLTSGVTSPAADIWSVGCCVVEMLTGHAPWSEYTSQVAALLHITQYGTTPALPEDTPAALQDFLQQCFQRDPTRRWTTEQLLNHPFLAHD